MEPHTQSCSRPSRQVVATLTCPRCLRGSLEGRHCKRLCSACGYVESCEDNFLPQEETPQRERIDQK